jgi:DNA-binding GntR family transcriptional regulator
MAVGPLRPDLVDPDGGEYMWKQVARVLTERIRAGEPPKGKLLPSVRQIAQALEVSDGTVKKALRGMKDDGIIASENGRGSYPIQ